MPKWCVVPTCKTGSRCEQSKHSLFRILKDIETWKKWEYAIPNILKLKATDVVCDKHFIYEDIVHEWSKQDANGQIITRVSVLKIIHTKFETGSSSHRVFFHRRFRTSVHD